MEIELAAIADYALTDTNGKMSVIGIWDSVNAPRFPVLHPQMYVCLRIAFQTIEFGTKHKLRIALHDQDGALAGPDIGADFDVPRPTQGTARKSVAQLALGYQGVVFQKPGVYSFDISIDNNHVKSLPLQVVELGTLQVGDGRA
jgi:hypothetical protein